MSRRRDAVVAAPALAADKLLTVTGDATVNVAPDTAVIRIGVTTSRQNRARSQRRQCPAGDIGAGRDQGSRASATATCRHRACRCSRNTIRARAGTARLLGFQVTNQLTVKFHDIDKLPGFLDRAIAAGANEMSGIEFIVSEQSKLLDQARDDAVADARRKAELYAKAAGVKVGQVMTIIEEGSSPPPRPMQAMRAAGVPVAPGEQTLRASVTVTYAIIP